MCVESDGCELEGCSSSDEVRTLSGSMSPGLKSNPDLHPCKPGQKFRAALLRCRSPTAAAGILSFGNVLNYMDRYTVAGKTPVLLCLTWGCGKTGGGCSGCSPQRGCEGRLRALIACSSRTSAQAGGTMGQTDNLPAAPERLRLFPVSPRSSSR